MDNPRFLPLNKIVDTHKIGGKARGLYHLNKLNLKIPPTYLLPISYFSTLLEKCPHYQQALKEWSSWPDDSNTPPDSINLLYEEILKLPVKFACLIPEQEWQFAKAIIRSNMNIEDSSNTSFAGCFASHVTTVNNPEDFGRQTLKVIASPFTTHAAQRLLEAGISPYQLQPAVLVQPFITAQIAGTSVSQSPQLPWRKQWLTEYVYGTGEELAQGRALTKTYHEGEIIPAELKALIKPLNQGLNKISHHYRQPQEVEWAWDGEQLWFLQMRPIATDEARIYTISTPGRQWSRIHTLERYPEPLTPLGWSIIQGTLAHNLNSLHDKFGIQTTKPQEMAISYRGWIYSDPSFFSFPQGIRLQWQRYLKPTNKIFWRIVSALGKFVYHHQTALTLLDLVAAIFNPAAQKISATWQTDTQKNFKAIHDFLAKINNTKFSAHQWTADLTTLNKIAADFLDSDLPIYLIKDVTYVVLKKIWQNCSLLVTEFDNLAGTMQFNRTIQMNEELLPFIDLLRQDVKQEHFLTTLGNATNKQEGLNAANTLSAEAHCKWQLFLDHNGHCNTSWDIANPSWQESPKQLRHLIEVLLRQSPKIVASSQTTTNKQLILKKLQPHISLSYLNKISNQLNVLENCMEMDEEQHFLTGELLVATRSLFAQAATNLLNRKLITTTTDIYFLEQPEVIDALTNSKTATLKFLVRKRRLEWQRACQEKYSFSFKIDSNSTDSSAVTSNNNQCASNLKIQGLPVSPGIARGPVHFADHIHEAKGIKAGAILVTTAPNPALCPLFPILGGLITETGGPLSHGFVCAREYHLPGISEVANVRTILTNGQIIEINGSTGEIYLTSPT